MSFPVAFLWQRCERASEVGAVSGGVGVDAGEEVIPGLSQLKRELGIPTPHET